MLALWPGLQPHLLPPGRPRRLRRLRRPLVARDDDTADALRARLRDYHTKTRPVLELFRAKEVVLEVDASQPAADVQTEIRKRLGVG